MRNYTVLFVLLVMVSLSISCSRDKEAAPAYQPLIQKNKIWSNGTLGYSETGVTFSPVYSYYNKIGNDTLLNGQKWSEILESRDENHEQWAFRKIYIKELNNRVFLKSGSNGNEQLVYDFNLKAGDMITLKVSAIDIESNFIVDSVKLLSLKDDLKRRHFYIHPQYASNEKIIWIEGIGSVNGFLRNTGMYYLIGGLERLICVEEDNVQVYNDTLYGFNKCFFQDIAKSGRIEHLIH